MTDPGFVSLASRVIAHASNHPERRAVVCDGEAISYAALLDRSRRCAARLQALGLAAGSDRRVAILAANSLDFVVVVVACQLAGVAVAPISGMITADAQARMIDDSNASILFYDVDHAEKALAAAGMAQAAATLILAGIGTSPAAGAAGGASALDAWLAEGTSPFEPVLIEPRWQSDLIYSSGTTGIPKGIVQDYATRSAGSVSLALLGVSDGSCVVQTVSLYSNYGLSSLYVTLWWAGTLFVSRKFSAAALVELLATEKIDVAWLVPATLVRAMDAPGFAEAVRNKPCVKVCMGAPLSREQKKAAIAAWPGSFVEGYGQTETGLLSMLAADAVPGDKLGSVGRIVPSACVLIIDDDGNVLPAGTEGEIAAHTSTMMSSYHRRGDADTTTYWSDESGRRFVRTGDVGKIDADGYLWLCDRKKDMVISGGFNVFPADIERVLQGHPAVFEVAVVGCPSARWGETPVAFLTLREGVNAGDEELRAWVNERVGKAQRVAAVRVLDALPVGTMGKILKRELRERFVRAMGTLP